MILERKDESKGDWKYQVPINIQAPRNKSIRYEMEKMAKSHVVEEERLKTIEEVEATEIIELNFDA